MRCFPSARGLTKNSRSFCELAQTQMSEAYLHSMEDMGQMCRIGTGSSTGLLSSGGYRCCIAAVQGSHRYVRSLDDFCRPMFEQKGVYRTRIMNQSGSPN
eukprot:scaffold150340_cov37-Tisochrysis_lutea.AAC.1